MTLMTLEDVCEFVLDGTHGSPVRIDEGVPVYSAKNVTDDGFVESTERFTTNEEYESFRKRLPLQIGDVLITIVGTIGRVAILKSDTPMVFQRSIGVLRPKKGVITSEYLSHYLLSDAVRAQIATRINKSTQAGIYLGKLKTIHIEVPSINKQKQLAEILSKITSIRKAIQVAKNQRTMLIHSFYADIMQNELWPVVKLEDVAENLDSRRIPIKASERIEGSIPYYGANGQQGSVQGHIFDEDLILVAEDGGHFYDRTRPIAYQIKGKSWVNNHAHVLRCNKGMTQEFLLHQLAYYEVRPFLTGSTRPKLNKGAMMKMPIVKPPLDIQIRFSEIYNSVNSLESCIDLSIICRDSMLQEFFA